MAKAREAGRDLAKVDAPAGVPSYLAVANQEGFQDSSLEAMKEYRVLPLLKIVQGMSGEELKKQFDQGDVILSPLNKLVAKYNKAESKSAIFQFVPVFFFVEFCKWADRNDKSSKMIVERSFDPTSEVAKRCHNENTRTEAYGELDPKTKLPKYNYRYVEHLNFPSMIVGTNELAGEMTVIGFSRGEFSVGKNFCTQLMMRKQLVNGVSYKVPMWANVVSANSQHRSRSGTKQWEGLDVFPKDLIPEDQAPAFQALNKELQELYDSKRLVVDRSDEDSGETVAEVDTNPATSKM